MAGGTIVARNYLAHARVVAQSFQRHHPNESFTTLIVDGVEVDRWTDGVGQVLLLDDLRLDDYDRTVMMGIYDVTEFCTAMKPSFLRHLVEQGGPVCYLDPDIEVLAPFPEIFEAAAEHSTVLSPHVLTAVPRDGRSPSEQMLMMAGLFNLGFITVSRSAIPMLEWWHERLRRDALSRPSEAMFTDQRWMDWVPSLFEHSVCRDPGINVAWWNLHERPLQQRNGMVTTQGVPVKFFHFSGYDSEAPWVLSKHSGARPRVLLSECSETKALCDAYRKKLQAAGEGFQRKLPYGFATTRAGLTMTVAIRDEYRSAVIEAEAREASPPPSPFAADGGEAFNTWLDEPCVGPPSSPISRFESLTWRWRDDLRRAFPNIETVDAEGFVRWLEEEPTAPRLPGVKVARAARERPTPARRTGGWNVAGYLSAELGVGESGRRLAVAVEQCGLPVHHVAVTGSESRKDHNSRRNIADHLLYDNSIFAVNADQIAHELQQLGEPWRSEHRRIGYWFWEVDVFPQFWQRSFEPLEEVWVSSQYMVDILTPISPIPVRMVPIPIWPTAPTAYTREHLGLSHGFTFLFCYDFFSILERKNPLDLLDAYCRAFDPDDGAHLVLKSINGDKRLLHLDRVRQAAATRPDVTVVDGYMSTDEVQGLIELADCFVSLHRSEGFGLNLAAAMAAGRPVIATGYSGNMAFMDAESAFLVPYHEVAVGSDKAPYPAEAHWAQPDLHIAAELMRHVFDDREGAAAVAARGRQKVLDCQSIQRAVDIIRPILLGDVLSSIPPPPSFAEGFS